MNKNVFKRYELKYVLTFEQYKNILEKIKNYLTLDKYGETTIQSLYYDTDTNLLIRNSVEKPIYKEKIRVRSYGLANEDSFVFLELKKKYEKVVFKRRISLKECDTEDLIIRGISKDGSQIEKEILYFCSYYQNLKPNMLLLYDRTAYSKEGLDLRITFDRNVRYRTERLNLHSDLKGTLLLEEDQVLMEIKTGTAYPLWLTQVLSENRAYKRRFSKYGTAYQLELSKKLNREKKEEIVNV